MKQKFLKYSIISMIFSIILMTVGVLSVTFYSLLKKLNISMPGIYSLSVDNKGFEVTMGLGLFFTFIILVSFLTFIILLGQIYADKKIHPQEIGIPKNKNGG